MKLLACSTYIFVLIAFNVLGQATKTTTGGASQIKKEEAIVIKNRPLIVVRTGLPQLDSDIEFLFGKIWKFNSEILFCDNETIKEKLAANKSGYTILSFDRVSFALTGDAPEEANDWVRASLKLSEKYNKIKPAFFQDIMASRKENVLIVQKREIIFALHVIQNHLLARAEDKKRISNFAFEAVENVGTLEKKILLIEEKFMNKKYTIEDLKVDYPFQFKISNRAFIEKALLERNKDYAFLEIMPMGDEINLMVHLIVKCEDGEIISYGEFYNGFGDRYSNFVSKSHAIAYVKYSDYDVYKEKQKQQKSK